MRLLFVCLLSGYYLPFIYVFKIKANVLFETPLELETSQLHFETNFYLFEHGCWYDTILRTCVHTTGLQLFIYKRAKLDFPK